MREKSDINKVLEGRCRGHGSSYLGFKKANESHSIGTASQIYDPICDRVVDTLSTGETAFFWLTRFEDEVEEIKEQIYLIPDIVAKIAVELGFQVPKRILTTDFLVKYKDGKLKAFSIKPNKGILEKSNYRKTSKWEALIRRQILEKRYWESLGVEWNIVFSENLNYRKANNIAALMKCYNKKNVTTTDHMYRYLIAHKYVVIDLEDYVPFALVANQYEKEICELYRKVIEDETE